VDAVICVQFDHLCDCIPGYCSTWYVFSIGCFFMYIIAFDLKQTKPVVLNHCYENRMRLPSTLSEAPSSLSIIPLILCVTDFVLL